MEIYMSTILRVRATLTYGNGGPGLFTSYWFPGTPGGSLADVNDCVARVRAFFASAAAQYPTSTTIQVQNDVAILEAETGNLQTSIPGTAVGSVVGSGGGTLGALSTMALLRLRSGVVINNRVVRGRWYMGPLAPGAVSTTGGTGAGTITAFNTAGAGLLAAGATSSVLVVWHRPGSAPGAGAIVTGVSTWDQLGVMRSRRDP